MRKSSRPETPRRGAQIHRVSQGDRFSTWRRHHQQVSVQALLRLRQNPVASLMTLAVLAIALALPGFMFSVVKNVQQFAMGWDTHPRVALYLFPEISDQRAEQLSLELMLNAQVAGVELIDKDKGLQEFASYSEFARLLSLLQTNPLPAVIIVLPVEPTPVAVEALRQTLVALPEVEEARVDMEWIQRLQAYIEVGQRFSWVLSGLLALAVLLVVGNTIRMTLESRRDEILVAKLVGATDAWVRRPFLYSGFWYGLLGAVLAVVLVQLAILLMREPVNHLAQLYMSSFNLRGLGGRDMLTLLLVGSLLGLAGGFLSTAHQLRHIERG